MSLMWTENKMDDPRFANSLLIASKNREIMQGLLKLRPIVGPIVRERKDGTWTTQDKIISESLTIMTEAIKNNP
ncbi:hypothetical protein HOH51_03950 [bacterium]|nr:hypothetical protein [bacterium]